ncbi:hypothetical protein Pfo_018974 [Paulownia fortunei]|nr:hypothetical protein Pfo_018974 [Paulownia fortunei]
MKGGRSKAESKKADAKLSVKKGAAAGGKKPVKKGKPAKDPNKPKRPASAFFVFMEEFRKQYKEKHPNNKSVAAVGKAGGDKWKSLSEAVSILFPETKLLVFFFLSLFFFLLCICFFKGVLLYFFQEKAPYVAKAEKRKADYEKSLQAYNKRIVIPSTDFLGFFHFSYVNKLNHKLPLVSFQLVSN